MHDPGLADRRNPCRLCGSESTFQFAVPSEVAGNLEYSRCTGCGSLQTQVPTWLDRAYEAGALGEIDTGALYRSQQVAARVWCLTHVLGLRRNDAILDFGGATGVLARLLRDLGLDAYVEDPHADDLFNRPFVLRDRLPTLVTAVEVLEHFDRPSTQLSHIFERSADYVVVSTRRYNCQDSSWYYLAPEGGQHVFFYSEQALHMLGSRFGYDTVSCDEFTLFSKPRVTKPVRLAFRTIAHPIAARLAMSFLSLRGRPGRFRDQELIIAKMESSR